MHVQTVIMCLVFFASYQAVTAETPGESALCGRSMYIQIFDQQFDTVLTTDTAGKTIVKIATPTAIGIDILIRMGHRVALLCQYRWELDKAITLPANNTRYKSAQMLVSNYLIEMVDSCSVTRAPGTPPQVTMAFSPCGRSAYDGRSIVTDTAVFMDLSQLRSPSGMFTSEDLERKLFRRVFGAYLILEKPLDLTILTRQVEKEMDRLKLDFSYKTPHLIRTNQFR